MRLFSPPEDWKDPLDLKGKSPEEVVRWLAKKHNWKVTLKGDKLFAGVSDRKEPAPPPVLPKWTTLPGTTYYSQRDSKVPGQWWRMCFSSATAMLVKFLKPNVLTDSPNADDEHLMRVLQYGDTTDPEAQLKALAHYGIKAQRKVNLSFKDITAQLKKGKPVPIGILIAGPVNAPSGGGHWIFVYGETATHIICHDPYGELDLEGGGYLHSNGKSRVYSKKNLAKRWMVEGEGTGWGIIV